CRRGSCRGGTESRACGTRSSVPGKWRFGQCRGLRSNRASGTPSLLANRQASDRRAPSNVRTSQPLSMFQINRQARQAHQGVVFDPLKLGVHGVLGCEVVMVLSSVLYMPV